MIRRSVVVLSCIVVASVVVVIGKNDPADAVGNERQFNMAGWPNGCQGCIPHAEYIRWHADLSVFLAGGSAGLPTAITTQEMCLHATDPFQGQFAHVFFRLNALTMSLFGTNNYGADRHIMNTRSSTMCMHSTSAAFALVNNASNPWWHAKFDQQFSGPAQDPESQKGYVCVFPTLWIVNYGVCSTHFTVAGPNGWPQIRDAQAYQFRDKALVPLEFINLPTMAGGDLNGTTDPFSDRFSLAIAALILYGGGTDVDPSWTSYPHAAGTRTCCHSGYQRKFDWFWFFNGWSMLAPGSTLIPTCVPAIGCGSAGDGRYSDHKILIGHVG